jgi:hypothetical protein
LATSIRKRKQALSKIANSSSKSSKTSASSFASGAAGPIPVADATDDADAEYDEVKTYQVRMSKWMRSAWACVADPVLWLTMAGSHKAREPLQHFFFLQMKMARSPEGHLRVMVCETIGKVVTELDALVATFDGWWQALLDSKVAYPLPDDVGLVIKSHIISLILKQRAAFHRRIAGPLSA